VWWRVQDGTTACVRMSSEQYETFCDDYDRYELQWLCDSCKGQYKETTQSEMTMKWGKMKERKSEKVLIRHIKKL